ncbi:MAG TPA: glutamine-hydrolyzing carbamoyl-phosphate synthase small subunit [Streptosporangiaceae bacterium]|nr:glutamine-hydrolyzing carbamoyl-phosphate synthase small subunit [Streptosporangiaceae bacterium]
MTGPAAVLVLEDGWVLRGTAFGAAAPRPPQSQPPQSQPPRSQPAAASFGEIVFNTGMTGYQETLTDPSYHRQIVAMTAPHIGNTGTNDEDHESRRIWVAGYVVRELARIASSWRAIRSLDDELRARGVPGIAVVGTRALTRHLRDKGAMRAAISAAPADVAHPDGLIEQVLASPSMAGADLAREVSTPEPYVVRPPDGTPVRYRVAAVDLGIKAMTPRKMAERGCEVHVLPATATTADILAVAPDGVFFSNGPGDPAAAGYAVGALRGVLDERVPVFGICLGSQILGRALGLGTYKLLFGHRGVNQPVADLATGRVHITSHNHGFAVTPPGFGTDEPGGADEAGGGIGGIYGQRGVARSGSAGAGSAGTGAGAPAQPFGTVYGRAEVSHVCLNDGVIEGLRLLDRPAFSVQYHPEAAPGPHDAAGLFDRFTELMDGGR